MLTLPEPGGPMTLHRKTVLDVCFFAKSTSLLRVTLNRWKQYETRIYSRRPPCQTPLWVLREDTGVPGENQRLSIDH